MPFSADNNLSIIFGVLGSVIAALSLGVGWMAYRYNRHRVFHGIQVHLPLIPRFLPFYCTILPKTDTEYWPAFTARATDALIPLALHSGRGAQEPWVTGAFVDINIALHGWRHREHGQGTLRGR